MSINLRNLRVLVTRPDPQGSELCKLIKACSGFPIHLPTLTFEPPSDQEAFKKALADLSEQEWLIFVSPQAVYAFYAAFAQHQALPPGVHFAAVGLGTAKALQEVGFEVSVYPLDDWSSEGLLDLPEFQRIEGKKIAIIRGEGGREVIDQVMKERGAEVLPVFAYKRAMPHIDMEEVRSLIESKGVDVVVGSSFEGMQNLKNMLGDAIWPLIKPVRLLVVSERLKELTKTLGFEQIVVAPNPTHKAILEAIANM